MAIAVWQSENRLRHVGWLVAGSGAAALPCDLADESALDNLRFVTPEELSGDMFNKLETWSQLALELFKNRGA